MPPRESKFTGFVAYYGEKKAIREKENYLDKSTNQKKATNWSEIDKNRLTSLELVWNDASKIRIDKKDHPDIKPEDWFFSQHAFHDMANQELSIVKRNIGYKKDGVLQVYSVDEKTGILNSGLRRG